MEEENLNRIINELQKPSLQSETSLFQNESIESQNTSSQFNSCEGPFLSNSSVLLENSHDFEYLQKMLQAERQKNTKLKSKLAKQNQTISHLNESLTNDHFEKETKILIEKLKQEKSKVEKLKEHLAQKENQEKSLIEELKRELARLASINSTQEYELEVLFQEKSELKSAVEHLKTEYQTYKKKYKFLQQSHQALKEQSVSSLNKVHTQLEDLISENSTLKQSKFKSINKNFEKKHEHFINQIMGVLNVENTADIIPSISNLKNKPNKLVSRIEHLVSQCSGRPQPSHTEIWKWIRKSMEGYLKSSKQSQNLKKLLQVNSEAEILQKVKILVEKEQLSSELLLKTQKSLGVSRAVDAELEEAIHRFVNF